MTMKYAERAIKLNHSNDSSHQKSFLDRKKLCSLFSSFVLLELYAKSCTPNEIFQLFFFRVQFFLNWYVLRLHNVLHIEWNNMWKYYLSWLNKTSSSINVYLSPNDIIFYKVIHIENITILWLPFWVH